MGGFHKFFKYSVGSLFGIALPQLRAGQAPTDEKTLTRCKSSELLFQNDKITISPLPAAGRSNPQRIAAGPIPVRSYLLLRIQGVSGVHLALYVSNYFIYPFKNSFQLIAFFPSGLSWMSITAGCRDFSLNNGTSSLLLYNGSLSFNSSIITLLSEDS